MREAADCLAECFCKLVQRGVPRETAQRFILQMLVALFAEDIDLLPKYFVRQLLDDCSPPASAYEQMANLRGLAPALGRELDENVKPADGLENLFGLITTDGHADHLLYVRGAGRNSDKMAQSSAPTALEPPHGTIRLRSLRALTVSRATVA